MAPHSPRAAWQAQDQRTCSPPFPATEGATSCAADREQSVHAVESLELDLSALMEVDVAAGHEVADDVRHQHLVAERLARDACRVVHRRPEEVVAFVQGVARMDTDPDANRR